jgi:hypothetical protein
MYAVIKIYDFIDLSAAGFHHLADKATFFTTIEGSPCEGLLVHEERADASMSAAIEARWFGHVVLPCIEDHCLASTGPEETSSMTRICRGEPVGRRMFTNPCSADRMVSIPPLRM